MTPSRTARFAFGLLIALIVPMAALTGACRRQRMPDRENVQEETGEPDQYSATIIHTIDDGTTRMAIITREARSGDMRRQEWTEGDQNRALIWRPDTGKNFLLDLERRVYVELEIGAVRLGQLDEGGAKSGARSIVRNPDESNAAESALQRIDRYVDDSPSPTSIEIQNLPTVVIDGYQCRVFEQRASFPDGHTEVTKRFRAVDLAGLILRIESVAGDGSAKVRTERKDVRIEVAPDAFVVPSDFKRIERFQ